MEFRRFRSEQVGRDSAPKGQEEKELQALARVGSILLFIYYQVVTKIFFEKILDKAID